MKQGLIWRIGNGQKVKIMRDRWFPRPSTYTIQSPIVVLDEEAHVSEIIDAYMKWWKAKRFFLFKKLKQLKASLISQRSREDQLVWHYTNNGFSIVKLAYHLYNLMQSQKGGETSQGLRYKGFWEAIWKVQVTNVVKLFLWRACKNDFCPQFEERKVLKEDFCPYCSQTSETTRYAI